MNFVSVEYFILLGFSFVIFWVIPNYRCQKRSLFISSLIFYGWWDYRFLALLLFTCTFNYLAAKQIHKGQKSILWLAVTGNLLVLWIFKYFNFFVASIGIQHKMLNLLLPLGLSFFTFQGISFIVDIYRKDIRELPIAEDFFFYLTFFPHLIAGPIVRAIDFLPQVYAPRRFIEVDFRYALGLFAMGYFKKSIVGDSIAAVIDPFFKNPGDWDSASSWFAAIAYSIQIYCDFSGYTDMAKGSAGLFGFRLCSNFNAPYFSRNLKEFWTRWHISLSTWLKDYLYIPLGGNQKGKTRLVFNLFITMVLGGLWHGASYNFIVWGALHGLGLVAEKTIFANLKLSRPLAVFFCFFWVVGCFVIFRVPTLPFAWSVFQGILFPREGQHLDHMLPWSLAFCFLAFSHWFWQHQLPIIVQKVRSLPTEIFALLCGAGASLLLFFTPLKVTPFIYFQF